MAQGPSPLELRANFFIPQRNHMLKAYKYSIAHLIPGMPKGYKCSFSFKAPSNLSIEMSFANTTTVPQRSSYYFFCFARFTRP